MNPIKNLKEKCSCELDFIKYTLTLINNKRKNAYYDFYMSYVSIINNNWNENDSKVIKKQLKPACKIEKYLRCYNNKVAQRYKRM